MDLEFNDIFFTDAFAYNTLSQFLDVYRNWEEWKALPISKIFRNASIWQSYPPKLLEDMCNKKLLQEGGRFTIKVIMNPKMLYNCYNYMIIPAQCKTRPRLINI